MDYQVIKDLWLILCQFSGMRSAFWSLLRGIEYNSSKKGKCVMTTESAEDCESENENTEVANDKRVSFNKVTNVG